MQRRGNGDGGGRSEGGGHLAHGRLCSPGDYYGAHAIAAALPAQGCAKDIARPFSAGPKRATTALTWPPGLGMGRPRFSKRPPFVEGEDLGTGGRVVKGSRL